MTAAHCDQAFKEKFEYRLLISSTQKKDMFDENKLHEISSSRFIHEKYEIFKAPDGTFGACKEDHLLVVHASAIVDVSINWNCCFYV